MNMLKLADIHYIGLGLNRPECVLAHHSGLLFASDWTGSGGVSVISNSGKTQRILSTEKDFVVRPNGIAVESSGSVLMAHLGDQVGGVYRLHPDGALEDVLIELDGLPLLPSNYIHIDHLGRFWITVSTRHIPRQDAYRQDVADGFVVLLDKRGARIVADDLGYTNECLVHPDGKRLFVNETFARRLSCFDIEADGSLSNRRVFAQFGEGTYPDGLTFDTAGGVWVTSIVSNRVIRVTEGGEQVTMLEDADVANVHNAELAFQANALDRRYLQNAKGQYLSNVSSLAFGGNDLRTAYLGSLAGDQIAYFTSPYQGVAPSHWNAPLDRLLPHLNIEQ